MRPSFDIFLFEMIQEFYASLRRALPICKPHLGPGNVQIDKSQNMVLISNIQNDIGDALRYLDTIVVDKNNENTYSYRYYVRANVFVVSNTIQLGLLAKQGNIFLMDSLI